MAHGVLAFRRQCFAMVSILSLLLCVAIIVLWVRSFWIKDSVLQLTVKGEIAKKHMDYAVALREYIITCISSSRGQIRAVIFNADVSKNITPGIKFNQEPADSGLDFWFAIQSLANPEPKLRSLTFPHWSLALLFAILPAFWFRSLVRARRAAGKGLCPHCGYDLRATPDRCPECGRERAVNETMKSER